MLKSWSWLYRVSLHCYIFIRLNSKIDFWRIFICATYLNSHKKNEGRVCNECLIIAYPKVVTSYEMNIITPFQFHIVIRMPPEYLHLPQMIKARELIFTFFCYCLVFFKMGGYILTFLLWVSTRSVSKQSFANNFM